MINLSSNCFINHDLYQELYKIEFKKKDYMILNNY